MTSSKSHGLSSASIETIAGLSAGLFSTIIVHPLDIIKTRLQIDASSRSFVGSSVTVLRGILHNEGPNRMASLYRGLTPNLIGNSAGWALYFLSYGQAQLLIRSYRQYDACVPLSSLDYLGASAGAGLLTAVITNPIWVVKTRMLSTSALQEGAYPSMFTGLHLIGQKEGLRGYFKGLTPSFAGVGHGALYFLAYEKLKIWKKQSNLRNNGKEHLTNTDTILTSSLSKLFAGCLTYPHQVIRARMQTYGMSSSSTSVAPSSKASSFSLPMAVSLRSTIANIWRHEGIPGFYKGLGPNLLRVVPSTCVTFLVYENVRWGLPNLYGGEATQSQGRVGALRPSRG